MILEGIALPVVAAFGILGWQHDDDDDDDDDDDYYNDVHDDDDHYDHDVDVDDDVHDDDDHADYDDEVDIDGRSLTVLIQSHSLLVNLQLHFRLHTNVRTFVQECNDNPEQTFACLDICVTCHALNICRDIYFGTFAS